MMANSTLSLVKILAVPGMHVIHEPCIWPISPQVLRSSVVRASDGCTEGHRFNSSRGLRFFLCPILVTCWSHHFSSLLCFFLFSSSLTAVSPSSLPVLSQYKTCPQHHALVLSLSSVLQTIAICCPGALIWNSIPSGGGSASNSSNSAVGSADAAANKPSVLGSPLDRLPIAPSQMPLPSSANAQGFLNSEVDYAIGQN